MQIDIATRGYTIYCPLTKTEYPVIDRLFEEDASSF